MRCLVIFLLRCLVSFFWVVVSCRFFSCLLRRGLMRMLLLKGKQFCSIVWDVYVMIVFFVVQFFVFFNVMRVCYWVRFNVVIRMLDLNVIFVVEQKSCMKSWIYCMDMLFCVVVFCVFVSININSIIGRIVNIVFDLVIFVINIILNYVLDFYVCYL